MLENIEYQSSEMCPWGEGGAGAEGVRGAAMKVAPGDVDVHAPLRL